MKNELKLVYAKNGLAVTEEDIVRHVKARTLWCVESWNDKWVYAFPNELGMEDAPTTKFKAKAFNMEYKK